MSIDTNVRELQDLTAAEMKDTSGGLLWLLPVLLLAGCATTGTNGLEKDVNTTAGN